VEEPLPTLAHKTGCRVLIPFTTPDEIDPLLALAGPCARAWQGRVIFLHIQAGQRTPMLPTSSPLLEKALAKARAMEVEAEGMFREAYHAAKVIRQVVEEKHIGLLVMGWQGQREPGSVGGVDGTSYWQGQDPIAALLADPPCEMATMHFMPGDQPLRRVLVPTAGGPNAVLSAEIAHALTLNCDCRATVLYIQRPNPNPAQDQAAQEAVLNTLSTVMGFPEKDYDLESSAHSFWRMAGHRLRSWRVGDRSEGEAKSIHVPQPDAQPGAHFDVKVIEASTPVDGILREARKDYDLVLIGASHEGVLHRVLFGEVPSLVARRCQAPVVIVKRPFGPVMSLARHAWDRLFAFFPTLSEEEQREVFKDVRKNARADFDFSTMITLSAGIAALGLLLNSPAVIIGAMLVAPLMAAIVGLGLAITVGDGRMLRFSAVSTLWGMLLAIGVGFLIGLIAPDAQATPEILGRTRPTLLDLGVALVSGAAGAYALCRKDVSASLPGVAIAVALVPPLATVGIGLSLGNWIIAGGALLLFFTNMVAIAAAGGTIFLLLGFKPEAKRRERLRIFESGMAGIVILLAAISIPLGVLTYQSVTQTQLRRAVEQAVATEVAQMPGVTLESVRIDAIDQEQLHLLVSVRANRSVQHEETVALQTRVATHLQRTVSLVLTVIPVTQLDPFVPPTFTPTPTPTFTPTPGPTATPTATPTSTFTPEPSATPTATPTATSTPTPTNTPTPTPVPAVVSGTGGRGVLIRWQPGGSVAGALSEGAQVEVLSLEPVALDGIEWMQVRDAEGRIGWVVARYLTALP